jgi:hypothetical protein
MDPATGALQSTITARTRRLGHARIEEGAFRSVTPSEQREAELFVTGKVKQTAGLDGTSEGSCIAMKGGYKTSKM